MTENSAEGWAKGNRDFRLMAFPLECPGYRQLADVLDCFNRRFGVSFAP
jgi:hypothetical protein